MDSEELEKVRSFLNEKKIIRQEQLDERFKQAQEECQIIISLIISKYNPQKIYQWGSLLSRKKFTENSDIDIAIEGLKNAEDLFRIYEDAENITDFPLDIIEFEKIHPLHQKSIKDKGKLVYEQ